MSSVISGIHHIVLKVSDPQRSKDFYRKVLEMEVFSDKPNSVGLTGAGIDSLWLVTPDNGAKSASFHRRGDIGLDHYAFTVHSFEDLKSIEARLQNEGIIMEDGGITDDGYGGTAIFTSDPDGMVIDFHLMSSE